MKKPLIMAAMLYFTCTQSVYGASDLHYYDSNARTADVTLYNLSAGLVYRVDKRLPSSCSNFNLPSDKHQFHIPDSVRAIGTATYTNDGKDIDPRRSDGIHILETKCDIKYCIKSINDLELEKVTGKIPEICFTFRTKTHSKTGTFSAHADFYFDIYPSPGPLNEEPFKPDGDNSRSSRTTKPYGLEPAPALISSRFRVTLQRYEKTALIISDVGPGYRCPLPVNPDTAKDYTCVPTGK